MRLPLALISAVLFTLPALAAAQSRPDIAETYQGGEPSSLQVRTIVLDGDAGLVAAEATVAIEGCSGSFTGTGTLKGNVLELRPYRTEAETENCVVTLTFDKTGTTATLVEDRCSYFHGAQCAFEGTLKAKRGR